MQSHHCPPKTAVNLHLSAAVSYRTSVVQNLDSAIIQWIKQLVSLKLFRWKLINSVKSAIQRLNNWGLEIA